MNQILSVEMPGKKKKKNKKFNIGSIIIFFCIILLIFGILMIGIGIYSKLKNNNENENQEYVQSKPIIEIVQKVSKLVINVRSDKVISNVVYKWNSGKEELVNGTNDTTLEFEINIPEGQNVLTITATDIDGVSDSFNREYTGVEEYKPKVEMRQRSNFLDLHCESDTVIKEISYYYDEKAQSTKPIGEKTGDISIDVMPGEHNLTVIVIDEIGREYKKNSKISAPDIQVVTDGIKFFVTGTDTLGLKKVEIEFNGENSEKELNSKEYKGEFTLKDGENRIIIKLTNSEQITYTKKIKWEKKR